MKIKNFFILILLFMSSSMVLSQNCTVNAGGNVVICGTSATLAGSSGGNTNGTPTWTLVSKPSGAPDPVISNINSYTPNVTGMTFPGNYVFSISQPCVTGTATSQVTITAPGDASTFTAGPDVTGISALVGVANLSGVVPPGYTASWRFYNSYYYERYNEEITTNATMSGTTTATPTLTLTKKANHDIDPAYRAVLRITSIHNPNCWYEDDAIVRFVPNPQIILPSTYDFCSSNSSRYMYLSSGSPNFDTYKANSAGNLSFGTTVTLNVISQPSGGNMTYLGIDNNSIDFGGVNVPGAYVFTLTVANANGSYTTPATTFNYIGAEPSNVSFTDAAYPEQMQIYDTGGSGGAVYCNKAGTTAPITYYFKINPADPTTITTTVFNDGITPPGGSPTLVVNGAGTMDRSITATPPAGGWRVGTYRMRVQNGNGTCSTVQDYYIHISDGNREDVAVDDFTVCYPGSGTVSATVPLPAVYKGIVNSSYFQDFDGRYRLALVSKPAGAADPIFEPYANTLFTNTSTTISNLDKEGEYVFKIKADTYNTSVGAFLNKEYACSGASLEDTFSIFVSTQINANAGSDISINNTVATLNGNNPGATSTGTWTLVSKPLGAPDPVIENPALNNTNVTGLTSSGTYKFLWTITTGSCISTDEVEITVDITGLCTEPVMGEDFSWSYPSGTPSPVTQTFSQPPTNYGFVLDIYELDNSFNLEINGVNIATQEIEFQSDATTGINVRFADGDEYETDTEGDIWQMTGTPEHPLIQVVISPSGNISLFGSKTSGGALFPLELFNGNTLNTITWNSGASNIIVATQNVQGSTSISESGYGLNLVECNNVCYKPGLTTGADTLDTKAGITSLSRAGADNADNWPMVRKAGWLALESKTKGFVPNRVAFEDADNDSVTPDTPVGIPATNFVEGMMVYDTTNKCLKMYTSVDEGITFGWYCISSQTCPD